MGRFVLADTVATRVPVNRYQQVSTPGENAMVTTDRVAGRSAQVVLMCGVAGSGKTTYAKRLEAHVFERPSIDEEIWRRFGRYGVDYAADNYPLLSDTVESDLPADLHCPTRSRCRRRLQLLATGQPGTGTSSLWKRLAALGRLIYLNVDVAELRRRLRERNSRFDANAAFPITDELLDKYLDSFEEPQGEGEELVQHGRPITDPVDHHRGIDHDAVHDRSR